MSRTADLQIRSIKSLFATSKYSDLTVICCGREFKVHKWVFDATSPVLRNFVTGEFKEAQENSGVVHFIDDDPDALEAMFHFMYNHTYQLKAVGSALHFAVKACGIADKYEVLELRELATAKFKSFFEVHNVNYEELMDAITLVHGLGADQALWDIVLQVLKKNIKAVFQNREFKDFILESKVLIEDLLMMLDDKDGGTTGAARPSVDIPTGRGNVFGRRLGGD